MKQIFTDSHREQAFKWMLRQSRGSRMDARRSRLITVGRHKRACEATR